MIQDTPTTTPEREVSGGPAPHAHALGPVVTPQPWMNRKAFGRAAIGAPIVLVAVIGFVRRWTYDDAFVYFRTVDHIMAGHGPVWNAGQRVEAFASPLWLAVLTVGDLLSPFRLEYTAAALSLACTIGALCLATAASTTMNAERAGTDTMRLPLGLAVVAALWPTWIWATGGMETGIVLFWLAACAVTMARWAAAPTASPPVSRGALVLLGLGWVVSSHFGHVSAMLVGVVIFGAPYSGRRRWEMFGWAIAVPAAYQILRMGYYGMALSTASVVREDSMPRPGYGWEYFRDFLSPYLLAVPLVAIALTAYVPLVRDLLLDGARRRALVVIAWPAIGIAHTAVLVVVIGGDSVHARQLLPALFAVLVPVFVVAAERRFVHAIGVTWMWAVLCGALLRPDADPSETYTTAYPGPRLTFEEAGYDERGPQPWMDGPGLYLADPYEPEGERLPVDLTGADHVVVVSPGVDVLSYVLGPDIDVLDTSGTGDPLIAHQRVDVRVAPGAEKSVYGPWVAARFAAEPSAIVPDDVPFERPFHGPTASVDLLEQVAWAQAALECPRVERLVDASTEPLGVGRFLGNVWNAMSNTTVRFGAVPERAYRDIRCASRVPASVVEFRRAVDVDSRLAVEASRGELAVAGRCDAAFIATGNRTEPWTVLEARERRATVELDPRSTDALFAAVFSIGPPGDDAAVVWLSTDGAGNVQVIHAVNWYPPNASAWMPIVDGSPIEIAVVPDLESGAWLTRVNGTIVGRIPMLAPARDLAGKDLVNAPLDGDLVASVPRTAAPGTNEPTIVHERYAISDTCRAIGAQHATPAIGAAGRTDVAVPSIT